MNDYLFLITTISEALISATFLG